MGDSGLDEAEFKEYALTNGYAAPELRSLPANKFFKSHKHNDDLILLIQSGEFTVTTGSKTEVFGAGDMCLVNANLEHTDQVGDKEINNWLAWRK